LLRWTGVPLEARTWANRPRLDLGGKFAQVLIVPGGVGALEHRRRCLAVAVPADPEAVTVGGDVPCELRVQALLDDGVLRSEEQILGRDGIP